MGFFKTLILGYKLMFRDLNTKHPDLLPRAFSGCGTGLMMIGSAVMAKTALKDDTREVLAECDAAIAEAEKSIEGEKKIQKTKRVFKAKIKKGLKVAKVFWKGEAMEVGGAALNGIGFGMEERGKHRALKAVGAIGAAFASYRAGVREDLGEEADLKYLTGQKAVKRTEKIDKKTGEVTHELEYADDDGVVIKKDPSAFKLLFSRETTPSVWSESYDIRKSNLEWIDDILTRRLHASDTDTVLGHISLNDMRREFGGLEPSSMDVDIGGIFGLVLDPSKPKSQQRVSTGWDKDADFMEGRKDWCWLTFPCDPEPIIGRIKKNKFVQVEK